jgi:FolB domain-containing protein
LLVIQDKRLTGFLASVANADEARIALEQGADFIDAKDPTVGVLAALASESVRQIVAEIAGEAPVSAVAGDLPMEPETIVAAVRALAATGVDYVMVGLFPDAGRGACIRALASLTQRTKIIGVMFADRGADVALAPMMQQAGFAGAMIDTAVKHERRLLDIYDPTSLMSFVDAFRVYGLLAGLAGSLELPDIPRLLPLSPDFLGFRGALCRKNGRGGRIEAETVRLVRQLIPRGEGSASAAKVIPRGDHGLLAAQRFSSDPRKSSGATDRVFVHDFVLSVRVGGYAHEREKAQRVRFNVDIDILRLDHVPAGMRDVLSYDLVTDGIGMIVAGGHITLVEELAERVAALVLIHPRVVRVIVRVEKLDIRPGSVGVEITRERVAESSGDHHSSPGPAARSGPKSAS